MKKILFAGILIASGGTYWYVRQQISRVKNLEYDIKNLRVISIQNDILKFSCDINVINRSDVSLNILSYNIVVKYLEQIVLTSISNQPISVNKKSIFTIPAQGEINLKSVQSTGLNLAQRIIKKESIEFDISGNFKVEIFGFTKNIKIEDNKFVYSENLLADFGLEQTFDNFMTRINNTLNKLGIKSING